MRDILKGNDNTGWKQILGVSLLAQEMAVEVGVEEREMEIGVADQVTGGTIAERHRRESVGCGLNNDTAT